MSVVAARVYDNKIVMAADSILVQGWSKDTKGDFTKINKVNDMLIGSVGTAEEGGLMQLFMKTHKPDTATEKDVLEFVVEFMSYKREITGVPTLANDYLFAYDGHLFFIQNLLIYEVKEYCAIGAGMDFANAALYLGKTPYEAVKTACDLSCMVAEPVIGYTMERNVK